MTPASCDMCDAWRNEALRNREQLQRQGVAIGALVAWIQARRNV